MSCDTCQYCVRNFFPVKEEKCYVNTWTHNLIKRLGLKASSSICQDYKEQKFYWEDFIKQEEMRL